MLKMPLYSNLLDFSYLVTIEEVLYKIRIYWNSRDLRWRMDLSDANDVLIRSGVKLISGVLIVHKNTGSTFTGAFLLLMNNSKISPEKFSLAEDCVLLYVPLSQIPKTESTELEVVLL